MRYSSVDNMRRHFNNIHTNPTIYKCEFCSEVFRRKRQLRNHIPTHTGKYTYNCQVCNRGFMQERELQKHVASHDAKCELCDRTFIHWSKLVAHRRIMHQTEYKCTACSKVFRSKRNLKNHMKVHETNREVFQCTYEKCSKFYYEKRNLTAHVRSKHEGRKFICDICGRELVSKQKMENHIKLHIQERQGIHKETEMKKKRRKIRADDGQRHTSMALVLAGVEMPAPVHKKVLKLKDEEVEFKMPSDVEAASSENESIF